MAGYVRTTSSAPIYFCGGRRVPSADQHAPGVIGGRSQRSAHELKPIFEEHFMPHGAAAILGKPSKIDSSELQHFATWKMRRPRLALERLVAFCILSLSLR